MSFEEWANDQPLANRIAMANCCRDAFRGGAASKQAELDELQKRIDNALDYANRNHGVSFRANLDLIDILKGEPK